MSMSMPNDEVALAFRRAYQVVVDQVDLPSDQVPVQGLTHPPRRPRLGLVVALSAALLAVLAGGFLLIGDDAPLAQPDAVQRVALVDVPAELGGEATVVNSDVSSNGFDAVPPVAMWHWESESDDGLRDSVILLEPESADADLTFLLGPTGDGSVPLPPANGEIESLTLPETGWVARSWVDGSDWRIAAGYDETSVAELAELTRGEDPSAVAMPGFELIYQGPQIIYPPADAELSELFYSSPAGGFSVALIRGWEWGTALVALRSPNAERTDVNGADAVIAGDSVNWWIAWDIGDSTALIESSDLEPDVLRAIAGGVQPVSVTQWENMATLSSTATSIGNGPTAESFNPVAQPIIVASGDDWVVKSQAIITDQDAAEPGQLGLCGWVETDGTLQDDFGCSIGEFSPTYPSVVSTPSGSVVTGSVRSEVAEIRLVGTTLAGENVVIDPRIPYGWFAVLIPRSTTITEFTFWDQNGSQLPIVEGGDEMTGLVTNRD